VGHGRPVFGADNVGKRGNGTRQAKGSGMASSRHLRADDAAHKHR